MHSVGDPTLGRNRRNTDWFFETWQGLMLDEDGGPLALLVNPAPFRGAHFATFSPKLVEPFVAAATSERGVCPGCLAPWRRKLIHNEYGSWHDHQRNGTVGAQQGSARRHQVYRDEYAPPVTKGWEPTCDCAAGDPVPATVLDPFFGAGSTGVAATRLGRDCIGVELHGDYLQELAVPRLRAEAPLLTRVEIEEREDG